MAGLCGSNASTGLIEDTVTSHLSELWQASEQTRTTAIEYVDRITGLSFDVPVLGTPITFASAVAGYTPFERPDTPAMPDFGSAPVVSLPGAPTLADGVDLSLIAGLEAGIEAFVAGNTEDASYARIVAAIDAAGAAEMQQTADLWAAAGWSEPSGPQALALLAAGERLAADKRAKLRDAFVDARDKALRIGIDAVRGQNDAIATRNRALSDNYDVTVRGARYALDTFDTTVRAKATAYDASARVFSALLGAESARVEADARLFGLDIENAKSANDVRLRDREISINATMKANDQALSAGEAAGKIAAQIASGLAAGVNVHAGMSTSFSASDSTSCSTSYSIDATPAE